jgi:hypothetical protein
MKPMKIKYITDKDLNDVRDKLVVITDQLNKLKLDTKAVGQGEQPLIDSLIVHVREVSTQLNSLEVYEKPEAK